MRKSKLFYCRSNISIIGVIVVIEVIRKNQYTHYDFKNKKANEDDTRKYNEELIYKLQTELSENARRWKDIHHLIVNGQGNNDILLEDGSPKKLISTAFFENLGLNIKEISIERKSVFVLTPFSKREANTFTIINKVCREVDLKCSRGDEVYHEGNILSHIVMSILQANIVIVNINGRNPNVFYELGICHAIGKPVLIISKSKGNLPFDINAKNIIFYNGEHDLESKLKNELLKIFINIINC